jgi:predicted DNA-binding transcriptional regulator YafY
MVHETSPTARALLVLEMIQNSPGITADRLGERLGVSERAVRRYVGILRETGVPIQSARGPYGGYRVGRGLRVPPLMFTTSEALGLVMAVLEGHHSAADPADPVGSALGKIIRVLPEPVAAPVDAVRRVNARGPDPDSTRPSAEITAVLVQNCAAGRRLRLGYRIGRGREPAMEVDPWAVVVRHGRWYLLCWSHTADAQRVLRVDRVASVDVLEETSAPPDGLDPVQALEEHLAEGWRYDVDVVVDAPIATVARWVRRNLGRLEAIDDDHTRLVGTTDEPDWYAEHLAGVKAPFHVVGPAELRDAVRHLGNRLLEAAG